MGGAQGGVVLPTGADRAISGTFLTFFWGDTPLCFPHFFSQKYFFVLKNMHMGDFFGRLLWGVIGAPLKHDFLKVAPL